MAVIGGAGFEYDASEGNFGDLPDGWGYREAAGVADADGNYPPDSIFGRIAARLVEYDRILADRSEAGDEL